MDASSASDSSTRPAETSQSLAGVAGERQVTTPATNDPSFRKFTEVVLGQEGSRELFDEAALVTPSVARPETATEVASSPGLLSSDASVPSLASRPTAKPNAAATAAATLADARVETVESVSTNVEPPVAEVEIEGTIGVEPPKGPSGSFGGRRVERASDSGLPTDEEVKIEVESKAVDVDVGGVPNVNAGSTDDAEDSEVVDTTGEVGAYEDDASINTNHTGRTEKSAVIIRELEKQLKAKKKENAVLTERLNQEQLERVKKDHAARLNQERERSTPISLADEIRANGRDLRGVVNAGADSSPAALGAAYRVGGRTGTLPTIFDTESAAMDTNDALNAVLEHVDGLTPSNTHPVVANPYLQKIALGIRKAENQDDLEEAAVLYSKFERVVNNLFFGAGNPPPPVPPAPVFAANPPESPAAAGPPSLAATDSGDSGSVGSNGGSDDTYEKNSSYMDNEESCNVGGDGKGNEGVDLGGVGDNVPSAPVTPSRRGPFIPSASVMGSPMQSSVRRNAYRDSQAFTRSGGLTLSESVVDLISLKGDPDATFLRSSPEKRKEMAELIRKGSRPNSGMTFDIKVIIPKDARLRQGATGYREEQDRLMATPGSTHEWKLSHKFTGWGYQSVAFKDKNVINDSDEKQVLDGYSENNLKFRRVEQHFTQYDFVQMAKVYPLKKGIDVNMPPEEMVLYDVDQLFDTENPKTLWTAWPSIDEKEIAFMQRFYNLHPSVCDEDMESNSMAYKFLGNVMTESLRKEIERVLEGNFPATAIGTTTLLWLMLNRVLKGTTATELILTKKWDKVTSVGPKVMNNGENISQYREYLTNILIRPLVAMNAFDGKRFDPIDQLLEGLTKCSVSAFSSFFEKVHTDYTSERFSTGGLLRHNVRTDLSSEENGNKCIDYLITADNRYHYLKQTGKWLASTAGSYLGRISLDQFLASGGKCFNRDSGCDGNHPLSACPKPHNEAKIKVRKEEHFKARDARRASAKAASGGGGGGGIPERAPTDANSGTPSTKKLYRTKGKGDNKVMQFKCDHQDCKKWGTHLTELHDRAVSMGDSFSMAVARPTHPGVKKAKTSGIPLCGAVNVVSPTTSTSGGPTKAAFEEYKKKKDTLVAQMALQTDKRGETYLALSATLDTLEKAFAQNF